MTENKRVPIYRAVLDARSGKHLTPDDRMRLDKFLDTLDVPRAWR